MTPGKVVEVDCVGDGRGDRRLPLLLHSWIAAKDAVDRGYTADRRVGQAQCTRRIFLVTEPDNYGPSQGLTDAMELEGNDGGSAAVGLCMTTFWFGHAWRELL